MKTTCIDDCYEPEENDELDKAYKREELELERNCRPDSIAPFDQKEIAQALQNDTDNEWGEETFARPVVPHPYLNAPLPILGIMHGDDIHRRRAFEREDQLDRNSFCEFLRAFAICHYARDLYRKHPEDQMNRLRFPEKLPTGFDANNRQHRSLGAAMFLMKRGGGSVNRIIGHYNKAMRFMRDRDIAEREQARFQISLSLLGPEYSSLSLRDLRVLMAVNSCMGEDGFGTINWRVLSWRAVGAVNEATLKLLNVRALGKHPVQSALESLQAHRLIQRMVIGRTTYVAKGSMSETVFKALVKDKLFRGKAPRAKIRSGKLVVVDRMAD